MKIVYPTWFELQFNDNNGQPLSSGIVYTKRSDSGANAVTYNENDAPNTNPVLLDIYGRAVIRLDSSFAYKFIVHNKNDELVYIRDKVYGTEFISGGVTDDHSALTNRDLADQHLITAITGLETALSAIDDKVNRSGDTMTGSLEVQTGLRLYYDTANPFSNQGAIDTFAGDNYASMYLTSDVLDNTKKIDSFVGLDYTSQTIKNGNSNQIYSYASDDLVDLQVTRLEGNSKIGALLTDDGLGNPKADFIVGVNNHSLQAQALSTRTQLINTDGASVDTLLFPTVTGATKTLATTSDIGTDIATHVALADPHAQYRLESASVPWSELSGVPSTFAPTAHTQAWSTISATPTNLAGYGITDAIDTSATAQTKFGMLVFANAVTMREFLPDVTTTPRELRSEMRGTGVGATAVSQKFYNRISASTDKGFDVGVVSSVTFANDRKYRIASWFGDQNASSIIDSPTDYFELDSVGNTYTSGVASVGNATADRHALNRITADSRYGAKATVGNLQLISLGNTAIGENSTTGERGHLVRMVNGTGATSIKGTLISASLVTDNRFVLQANEFDAFGVVAEAGVANGAECWIWVNGSTCEVLWENTQSSTRGYLALCAVTDGRARNVAVPDSNPVIGEHFKEIGHVLQSKGAGTNILVLCQIHFN